MNDILNPENQHRKTYEVTNKIIKALEEGWYPMEKNLDNLWLTEKLCFWKQYRGINQILMLMTEHTIPYFMTFKQALGGKVKKGSNF